jgi:hypothetical protein
MLNLIYYSNNYYDDNYLTIDEKLNRLVIFHLENISAIYDDKFYIKLQSYGEYTIKIYEIMANLMFDYEQYELMDKLYSTFDFINLFANTIIINSNSLIIYNHDKFFYTDPLSHKITTTPLKNLNYTYISPYDIIFKKIFKKCWSDVLDIKKWHKNDENIRKFIIHFYDSQYLIVLETSL